ncbi:MAG: hypothetical protein K2H45_05430 [Acetatifactor sp.]|nr:hypothetical protein [Acetatifactor sp.]
MIEEIQQLIVQCKAAYEAEKDDAFLSNVRHAELEELQSLSQRLQEMEPAELLRFLREEQPALEARLKEEEDHPTFDWYDEYHHAKRLAGVLAARRSVMKLLETHKDSSD